MTELRRSMIEGLQRRGVSERTQDMSVRAVRHLAEHDRKSPDLIREEALRQYCLSVKNVTPYSRSASTIARCGITCFFEQPLHRDGTTWRVVRVPGEQKLPVILSRDEVRRLLDGVRRPRDRVCLPTLSSGGLRLQEGTHLKGPAIASARLLLHVRQGKGGNDRDVPWPHRTLARLRQSWGTPRHPVLIFPAPGRGGHSLSTATAPRPRSRVQGAFREALNDRGIHTQASVPTRRHAWATHVLEAGVNLRRMQADLGHRAPTTTSVDTPLTASAAHLGADAITRVMEDLCWWSSRRCSASMAPRTVPNVTTGGGPVIGGPCRTWRRAARRRAAARSITVRPAKRTMTATTPVRTGTVPTASRTRPSQGSTTTSVCGCRSRTAWGP
jgi:integrase/recombinase XerD